MRRAESVNTNSVGSHALHLPLRVSDADGYIIVHEILSKQADLLRCDCMLKTLNWATGGVRGKCQK